MGSCRGIIEGYMVPKMETWGLGYRVCGLGNKVHDSGFRDR